MLHPLRTVFSRATTVGSVVLLVLSFGSGIACAQGPAGRGISDTASVDAAVVEAARLLNPFWAREFANAGYAYTPPVIVPFKDTIKTGGCGTLDASGIAYLCSRDGKIYYERTAIIALARTVVAKTNLPVKNTTLLLIAHEWGHYVRYLLQRQPGYRDPTVKLPGALTWDSSWSKESEADCLTGAFARSVPKGRAFQDADLAEAGATLDSIADTSGPNCGEAMERRYHWVTGPPPAGLTEFYESCMQAEAAEQLDPSHGGTYARQSMFVDGFFDHPGLSFSGALSCGPVVSGRLARGPKSQVQLKTYCDQQFKGVPRRLSTMRAMLPQTPYLPFDEILAPIFKAMAPALPVPMNPDIYCIAERKAIALDARQLDALTGRYEIPAGAILGVTNVTRITIEHRGTELVLVQFAGRDPIRIALRAESPVSFFVPEENLPATTVIGKNARNVQVTFQTGPQGSVTGLTIRLGAEDLPARRVAP